MHVQSWRSRLVTILLLLLLCGIGLNGAFVIAAMGQNGSKPAKGAMLTIQQAQLAMNDIPAFKGNVKTIRTGCAHGSGGGRPLSHLGKEPGPMNLTGGDHPYHYLGSAIWFTRTRPRHGGGDEGSAPGAMK